MFLIMITVLFRLHYYKLKILQDTAKTTSDTTTLTKSDEEHPKEVEVETESVRNQVL